MSISVNRPRGIAIKKSETGFSRLTTHSVGKLTTAMDPFSIMRSGCVAEILIMFFEKIAKSSCGYIEIRHAPRNDFAQAQSRGGKCVCGSNAHNREVEVSFSESRRLKVRCDRPMHCSTFCIQVIVTTQTTVFSSLA
jgi:hypothetical protein